MSSGRPIGPRACSFWVEMPISAPNPNSPPSVNRVEALTITAAESTAGDEARGRRDRCRSRSPRCARCDHRRMCAQRVVEGVDDAGGDVERVVLRGPVLVGDGREGDARGARRTRRIRASPWIVTPALPQRGERDAAGTRRRCRACTSTRLGGVADADPLGLGVDQDGDRLVDVGGRVDVDVAVADARSRSPAPSTPRRPSGSGRRRRAG